MSLVKLQPRVKWLSKDFIQATVQASVLRMIRFGGYEACSRGCAWRARCTGNRAAVYLISGRNASRDCSEKPIWVDADGSLLLNFRQMTIAGRQTFGHYVCGIGH